jgi:hypothetical protein
MKFQRQPALKGKRVVWLMFLIVQGRGALSGDGLLAGTELRQW